MVSTSGFSTISLTFSAISGMMAQTARARSSASLLLSRRETKVLELAAKVLQGKGDLLFDLRDTGNRVLALARERDIGRCHVDEDEHRPGRETALLRGCCTTSS